MGKDKTPKASKIAQEQSKKAHKAEKLSKKEESEDSSSDDSSSDSSTPPPPKNTHTPKKRETITKPSKSSKSSKKSKKEESSDSSSSDSSSSDSSSSDSSSSSSDKKSKSSSDSSSSDSDSSSSSSSKKAKSDSDSSDSSSDSSSSESSSSSSKATPTPVETHSAPAEPSPTPSPSQSDEPPTVFIGNLSYSSTVESLVQAFSSYGCTTARIITDRQTGRSKGFGYLEFETQDGANKAVEEMNNASVDGRNVRLDVSNGRPARSPGFDTPRERTPYQNRNAQSQQDSGEAKTLFIGNLSFQTNEDSIYGAFQSYNPTSCRVAMDRESGRSKGFGYVDFESHEQAEKAKNEMTDFELDGRNIRIDYSLPRQPREGGFTPRGDRGGFTPRGNRGRGDRGGFTPRGSRGTPRRGVGGTPTKMSFD
ncbi:putative Nuclear localization sequence-binding protein [Blattamonas nauphoetae]|uniref:Nuclear localization sequence-binding protein n=1 Tax=Blattamonas nauphoetae TaxID=2049346 RepID=A0ABQ9Y6H1_9EUKA|nr:putative Nuclear localization sequence-binding protein [Blattamonas nauphoetae]